jgi:hypothetical protein
METGEIKIIWNAGRRKIHERVRECRLLTTWKFDGHQWRLSSITRDFDFDLKAPTIKIGYWTYQKIVRHHRLQLRKSRTPGERRDKQIEAVKRHRIRTAAYHWKREYVQRTGEQPTNQQIAEGVRVTVDVLEDAMRLRMGNNYEEA